MSIDYSGFEFEKPRPRALDKRDRDRLIVSTDVAESRKMKERSGGQCEVIVEGLRCERKAFQVHHILGGWGRRARGRSALAEHKQHLCSKCHDEITGRILQLNARGDLPQWDDAYERVW